MFYASYHGIFSSRKIAARLYEEVAFIVRAGGNKPDFRTINGFTRRHIKSLPQFLSNLNQIKNLGGFLTCKTKKSII
ncbi:MAG: transposase [Bacillota bacterium]